MFRHIIVIAPGIKYCNKKHASSDMSYYTNGEGMQGWEGNFE